MPSVEPSFALGSIIPPRLQPSKFMANAAAFMASNARTKTGLIAALVFTTLFIACGSPAAETPPLMGTEFSMLVLSTDLALGDNRVLFAVIDSDRMPVRPPAAQVQVVYSPSAQEEGLVRSEGIARFVQWPIGPQGVFSTYLSFDEVGLCTQDAPGCWQLVATGQTNDGRPFRAQSNFTVREASLTPAIGSAAPASVTLTGGDVDDLAKISSAANPDPDLYRLSVHEALAAGKPVVIVFATPAFCVTATCGPQVEVLSSLKNDYHEKASFLHVEVFENPHLIQGGRPVEGTVPAVTEWNLPTEPWTFVVDQHGIVRAKFEAFTTVQELEPVLQSILDGPS